MFDKRSIIKSILNSLCGCLVGVLVWNLGLVFGLGGNSVVRIQQTLNQNPLKKSFFQMGPKVKCVAVLFLWKAEWTCWLAHHECFEDAFEQSSADICWCWLARAWMGSCSSFVLFLAQGFWLLGGLDSLAFFAKYTCTYSTIRYVLSVARRSLTFCHR